VRWSSWALVAVDAICGWHVVVVASVVVVLWGCHFVMWVLLCCCAVVVAWVCFCIVAVCGCRSWSGRDDMAGAALDCLVGLG
jgi:hypothetical protein